MKMEDYLLYNEEEELVSRNYLIFLEERFSSKANETNEGGNSSSKSTFGSSSSSVNLQQATNAPIFDALIIKAKLYILEILEVHILTLNLYYCCCCLKCLRKLSL
jgi:hypothetical protein